MPSVQHRINNKRPQTKAELAKQKDNRKSVSIENTDPNYILQFYSDCLRRHNELRRFHGCKKLKFSDELALQAQDWAEYLCDEDKYGHSLKTGNNDQITDNNIGENLAFRWYTGGSKRPKGDEIANVWYNEIKDYSWEMPELNETRFAGHFTQLIWNSTEYVGFGVAADGQGKVTVVAQYSPKGNIKFQYDANVPPRMDGILHNFPEEGAAFTIPKGERKTLEDIKKEGGTSSLFVEKSDSGNEENTTQTENTLDDNFSELNSTQGNASQNNNHNNFSRNNSQYKSKNSNIQNPHNRIQEEYSNEDEGRASSITEDKSNSSLSVEDIKIEDNDGLGELVTDFSQQTTLRASHRITTSLKRHQCTLDNLNMYSIKSNAARKEEISDFFQYEMIYGDDQQNLILDMLNAHNTYRKMHGCKPYLLSPELCRTAQEHAKKLGINGKQANELFFQHSKNHDFGENIAIYMDDMNQPPKNKNNYTLFPETMAHEVTENWYNKKDDSNPELRAPFGQIIWSDTVLMGVGVKKISNSERKEYAIVCNYYPPGNVELNKNSNFQRTSSMQNSKRSTADSNKSNHRIDRNNKLNASTRSQKSRKKKTVGCCGCC